MADLRLRQLQGAGTVTPDGGVGQNDPVTETTSRSTESTNGSDTNATASSSNNGHSAGELAGAAVGAAIGGALIAFLVAWLLLRRQRSARRGPSYGQTQSYDSKTDAVVVEKPLSKQTNPTLAWQAYLPQSDDDKTIQDSVKTLFDQVDQHVENFYEALSGQSDELGRQALARLDSNQLPGPLVELLQDERLGIIVIKHCIAALLIENITPSTRSEDSLLPAYLSSVIPKNKTNTLSAREQDVIPQAYSQWKLLTAYLHPRPDKDSTIVQDRNTAAVRLSELLDAALGPWQTPTDDRNAFKQHEKSLITYASNVGILILSQPSSFRFRWNTTADGLWKTTDETGIPLKKPQLLLSPVVVRT